MKLLKNKKGQALIEFCVISIGIAPFLLLFFIYIYRAVVVNWSEFQLNEALYCEQTKILQNKNPIENKKNKVSTTNPQRHHRINHSCLATAKRNINRLIYDEKANIYRNNEKNLYKVEFKWDEQKFATIYAENKEPSQEEANKKKKDLLSRLLSSFSRF